MLRRQWKQERSFTGRVKLCEGLPQEEHKDDNKDIFQETGSHSTDAPVWHRVCRGGRSVCLDEPLTIASGGTEFVHTGLAVEIPAGLVGLVYARSGLACKKGLAPANKVGVIDSDYRGEIMVALHNHSSEDITIEAGERVAQMVIAPYVFAQYEEVQELEGTVRGDGGFGSTGTK